MENASPCNFSQELHKRVQILGFPDDLGIRALNGRSGASLGPQAFSEIWRKFPENAISVGLLALGQDLETNYHRAQEAVGEAFNQGRCPVVIGGGHDYAYPWIKAFAGRGTVGVLNVDAHFDLRRYHEPHVPMSSGAPFRRLIQEGILRARNLVEFGIQAHANAPELFEYVRANRIRRVTWDRLRDPRQRFKQFKAEWLRLEHKCDAVFLSVDLDAFSYAYAPGVSSPQAEGFCATDGFEMMEWVRTRKKGVSVGFFELSPPLDHGDLTSRFCAQMAWHFVYGKTGRLPSK